MSRDTLLREHLGEVEDSPAWKFCDLTCRLQGFRHPCPECKKAAREAEEPTP